MTTKTKIMNFVQTYLFNDRTRYLFYRLRYKKFPAFWADFPIYFVHIPKCAGVSIADALGMPDPCHQMINDLPKNLRNSLKNKPTICAIRPPRARLLSTFNYALKLEAKVGYSALSDIAKMENADKAILKLDRTNRLKNHYFLRPAADHIISALANGMPVYLFGLSDINTALQDVSSKYDIDLQPIKKLNISKPANLEDSLSENVEKIITKIYRQDIQLCELVKDGPIWIKDIDHYNELTSHI